MQTIAETLCECLEVFVHSAKCIHQIDADGHVKTDELMCTIGHGAGIHYDLPVLPICLYAF